MQEKEKKYSRTFPIQEYLYRMIAKTSSEQPERLPSERDLSKEFDVARTTVRNAIAEVEASGAAIRLPGKKGLFTNPERSQPDLKFVAMIFLQGVSVSLSSWMATIFAETHQELNTTDIYYQTITIPEHFLLEETKAYLMRQNYDAIIWFFPTEKFYPLIMELLEQEILLTIFQDQSFLSSPHPAVIVPDHTELYQHYAVYCKQKNYRSVCQISWGPEKAELFRTILERNGIQDFTYLPANADLKNKINEKQFDFIFSPGSSKKQKEILETISLSPNRNAEIILSKENSLQKLKNSFTTMNIQFSDTAINRKIVLDMGRRAAKNIQHTIYHKGESV